MIDIDGGALLQRDRRYWTNGYTLRDQVSVPKFLKDVLQEAFRCGKALNLLKICSPKVSYAVNSILLGFVERFAKKIGLKRICMSW